MTGIDAIYETATDEARPDKPPRPEHEATSTEVAHPVEIDVIVDSPRRIEDSHHLVSQLLRLQGPAEIIPEDRPPTLSDEMIGRAPNHLHTLDRAQGLLNDHLSGIEALCVLLLARFLVL